MSNDAFNWTCPHCERDVTISGANHSEGTHVLEYPNATGQHAFVSEFIVCPNRQCRKYTLRVAMFGTAVNRFHERVPDGKAFMSWRLVPWGASRNFPNYVPQAVREDYKEACAIVELSPKAAATLARRTVQGIVRDYWKIVKATLFPELKELATHVGRDITQETWDSIDVVRSVGNIGAHMEQDINIIVDVDPEEARLLIQLIETLVADTYVARRARQQHHAKLLALKNNKAAGKDATPTLPPPADVPDDTASE